jgi:hypothetical protein
MNINISLLQSENKLVAFPRAINILLLRSQGSYLSFKWIFLQRKEPFKKNQCLI